MTHSYSLETLESLSSWRVFAVVTVVLLSCIAFREAAFSGSPCYISLAPCFYLICLTLLGDVFVLLLGPVKSDLAKLLRFRKLCGHGNNDAQVMQGF